MKLISLSLGFAAVAAFALGMSASAAVIYGNSAAGSSNPIHYIDRATGAEFQRFVPTPNGNGRGIVVIGDVVYYTITNDPHIYKMDRATGTPMGSILTTNASMSTIAFDGHYFWTADYSGTNRAFKIDPATGANVDVITLANAAQYMDGLEYFNGKLIGNRCDACGVYDIYDLSGNVLVPDFITVANGTGTGIAFDGTDFFVSHLYSPDILVFDGTTGILKETIALTSTFSSYFLIEDLSVDYAGRPDTCGGVGQPPCGGGNPDVPEPMTLLLFGAGLAGLGGAFRKKRG